MKIKLINTLINIPKRGTDYAAGYDVFMPLGGLIHPGETIKVKLGFSTEIPEGYAAQLMPRSSFGSKGLVLSNTIGLIDADYRGEWVAVLHNRGEDPIAWNPDDRLVQFVIVSVLTPELEVVNNLGETVRGDGGFGSTGQ